MDDYLNLFREMISLRTLTEHAAKSYSTYIKTYLFLSLRDSSQDSGERAVSWSRSARVCPVASKREKPF